MAFKMSVQKSSGKISEVVIGTGDKAIKLGGERMYYHSIALMVIQEMFKK